jgi:WD40 repeat protein
MSRHDPARGGQPAGQLEDLEHEGDYAEYEHGYEEEYYDEGNYHYHEGEEGGYYDESGHWYPAEGGEEHEVQEGHEGYGDDEHYYYDEHEQYGEHEQYAEHYDEHYEEGEEGEYAGADHGHGYDQYGEEIYPDEIPPVREATEKELSSKGNPMKKESRKEEKPEPVASSPEKPPNDVVAQHPEPPKNPEPAAAEIVKSKSEEQDTAVIRVPVKGQRVEVKTMDRLPSFRKPVVEVDNGDDAKPVFNNFRSPIIVNTSPSLSPAKAIRKGSENDDVAAKDSPIMQPAQKAISSRGFGSSKAETVASTVDMDSRPSSSHSIKSSKVLPSGITPAGASSQSPITPIQKLSSAAMSADRPSSSRSTKATKVAPVPIAAEPSSDPSSKRTSASNVMYPSKTPPKTPPEMEKQKPGHIAISVMSSRSNSGNDDNSGSDSSGKKVGKLAKMLSGSSMNGDSVSGPKRRRCFSGNKRTTSFLNAVCISANPNPMVFVASADSSTLVYDAMTGDQVHTMTGHSDRVLCLASSVPGDVYFTKVAPPAIQSLHGKHFIVSGGRDENVCIWDADTFKNLHTLHAHKGPVWAVAAVIVGEVAYAISSSSSGSIRVWDASSGLKIYNLKGQKGKVLSLYILDRRAPVVSLLSCGEDKNIHVWDVVAGRHIKLLEGHEEEVTSVAAGNFQQLASMQSIEVATKATMKASGKLITLIVSGSRDKSVRVWDYEQGIALFVLGGHIGAVFGVSIAVSVRSSIKVSANTPIVMSGSEDGSVILWSLETGKAVKEMKGHVNSIKGLASALVESAPGVYDREMLAVTCGWDKQIHFFDIDDTINADDSGCKCSIM